LAFDAKNLRVQLPCGPVTVFPCRFDTGICFEHTFITCAWGTGCRFPTYRCPSGSCLDSPTICRFGGTGCGPGSPIETIVDTDTGPLQQATHVSVEDLGALREALAAQLKEVDAAVKKVAQYEKEQG
jgi:hypothetical protein